MKSNFFIHLAYCLTSITIQIVRHIKIVKVVPHLETAAPIVRYNDVFLRNCKWFREIFSYKIILAAFVKFVFQSLERFLAILALEF